MDMSMANTTRDKWSYWVGLLTRDDRRIGGNDSDNNNGWVVSVEWVDAGTGSSSGAGCGLQIRIHRNNSNQDNAGRHNRACMLPLILVQSPPDASLTVTAMHCCLMASSAQADDFGISTLVCALGLSNGTLAVCCVELSSLLSSFDQVQELELGYYSVLWNLNGDRCQCLKLISDDIEPTGVRLEAKMLLFSNILSVSGAALDFVHVMEGNEYLLVNSAAAKETLLVSFHDIVTTETLSSSLVPTKLRTAKLKESKSSDTRSCARVTACVELMVCSDHVESIEMQARKQALLGCCGLFTENDNAEGGPDCINADCRICLFLGTSDGQLSCVFVPPAHTLFEQRTTYELEVKPVCSFERSISSLLLCNLRPLDNFSTAVVADTNNGNDTMNVDAAAITNTANRGDAFTHVCVGVGGDNTHNNSADNADSAIIGIGTHCVNGTIVSDNFCCPLVSSTASTHNYSITGNRGLEIIDYCCSGGVFIAQSHESGELVGLVVDTSGSGIHIITEPMIVFNDVVNECCLHAHSSRVRLLRWGGHADKDNCTLVVWLGDDDCMLTTELIAHYQLTSQEDKNIDSNSQSAGCLAEIETETTIRTIIRMFKNDDDDDTAEDEVSDDDNMIQDDKKRRKRSDGESIQRQTRMTESSDNNSNSNPYLRTIRNTTRAIADTHSRIKQQATTLETINREILRLTSLLSCVNDFLHVRSLTPQTDDTSKHVDTHPDNSDHVVEFWRKHVRVHTHLRRESVPVTLVTATAGTQQRVFVDTCVSCSDVRMIRILHGVLVSLSVSMCVSTGGAGPIETNTVCLQFVPVPNEHHTNSNDRNYQHSYECRFSCPVSNVDTLAFYHIDMQVLLQMANSHDGNNECVSLPLYSRNTTMEEILAVMDPHTHNDCIRDTNRILDTASSAVYSLSVCTPTPIMTAANAAAAVKRADVTNRSTQQLRLNQQLTTYPHRSQLPSSLTPLFARTSDNSRSNSGLDERRLDAEKVKQLFTRVAAPVVGGAVDNSSKELPYWQVSCSSPQVLAGMQATARLAALQHQLGSIVSGNDEGSLGELVSGKDADNNIVKTHQYHYRYQYSLPWELREVII
jgi:hypothetical protein